jgi:hypothetical protein
MRAPEHRRGGDRDTIVTGPDGNRWINDLGTPKAVARISLQIPPTVITGAAGGVTSSANSTNHHS